MSVIKVRVRDGQRGFYGIVDARDGHKKTGVIPGTEIIRNGGEVFDMDLRACKPAGAVGTGDCEEYTVKEGKTLVLPSWVESCDKTNARVTKADEVPTGHKTTHGAVSDVL